MTISIADMNRRVIFEQAVLVPEDAGGFDRNWIAVATVWAAVRPVSAREDVKADQRAGTVTQEIVIRHRGDIAPAMRVRIGDDVLAIAAVTDLDGTRRWLRCLAERQLA
ncbi:MAG: phage head closure protein [Hyphomicrobiaceae bacterium]